MSMPTPPVAVDVPGSNDMVLRLWDHGGDGPVVLFVHGFLDTGRSFDAAARALTGTCRCLCLTWRGHGQSGRIGAGGAYHVQDHLKDLSVVVEHIADAYGDIAAIVAHSMGGNVALLYAGARPARIPRYLLIDALGPPSEPPEAQPDRLNRLLTQRGEKKPFAVVADHAAARARLQRSNPGLSDVGADRMLVGALAEDDAGWRFNFDARLRGPVPVRYPEAYWLSMCEHVTACVHVLRAEFGYVPEGEPSAGRLAAMPDATLETVKDAQHHVHVEQPDLIAAATRALLARAVSSPDA